MDYIKQWTICICITLVVSVIFSVLTPKGKMQSFYKIIISVFIFLSFLYPFTTGERLNFSFDDIDDVFAEEQSSFGQNLVESQITNLLNKNSIIGASVTSNVSLDNDELCIDDVQISVPDEYNVDNVRNLVFNELGINARVIHIGE